jgi:hypothetical protein
MDPQNLDSYFLNLAYEVEASRNLDSARNRVVPQRRPARKRLRLPTIISGFIAAVGKAPSAFHWPRLLRNLTDKS